MIHDWGPRVRAYMAGLHAGCIGDPIHPPAHDHGCWHMGYWHGFCHRDAQERAAHRRGGDRAVVDYRRGLHWRETQKEREIVALIAK